MFGPAFTAGLAGVPMRADWAFHTAANNGEGATLSASSFQVGYDPYRIHDNPAFSGTDWRSSGSDGAGQWIQVQFDSYRRATSYIVQPQSGTSSDIILFDLLGSTDGASWTTLDGNVTRNWSAGSSVPLTDQTPFLFYRLSILGAWQSVVTPPNVSAARVENWSFTFSPT